MGPLPRSTTRSASAENCTSQVIDTLSRNLLWRKRIGTVRLPRSTNRSDRVEQQQPCTSQVTDRQNNGHPLLRMSRSRGIDHRRQWPRRSPHEGVRDLHQVQSVPLNCPAGLPDRLVWL